MFSLLYRGLECKYEIWEVKHGDVWSRYKSRGGESECEASAAPPSQLDISSSSAAGHQEQTTAESVASAMEMPSSADLQSNVSADELDNENNSPADIAQHLELYERYQGESQAFIATQDEESHETEVSESSSSEDDGDLLDPANFSQRRIDNTIINALLNKPCQPGDDFTFPLTNGRHCRRSHFYRSLPDGTNQQRKWLSYSISSDRLYCIHCMLFGGPSSDSTVWVGTGYNSWGNSQRDLVMHESTLLHRTAETNRLSWLFGKQMDNVIAHQRNAIIMERRNAVAVEIKALQWLASEMIAVRGHDSNHGKFMSLYRLLADYDLSAKAYLDKLQAIRAKAIGRKPSVNILSPRNVRRLLNIMKAKTIDKIVHAMKLQGVCSIINDGTQDLSKLEASCLLIRYIEGDENGRLRPVERLVGLFTTGSTTGQTLCDKILVHLAEANIPISHIIGQSYDGAGNMSGRFKGLQAKIKEMQPKAIYVWCSAHRLNLVIESVVSCCAAIRNAIGILQELNTFFGSHKRHEVLINLQRNERYRRSLKRVSDTTRSWRCVEDGCTTILECFHTVVTALEQLRDESDDAATVSAARGLYMRVNEFDVILSVHILKSIFDVTGPVSRILQSKASDLAISSHLISTSLCKLEQMRADESAWQDVLLRAQNCSHNNGIERPTLPQRRQEERNERLKENTKAIRRAHFR
jgi:hypothetical protein